MPGLPEQIDVLSDGELMSLYSEAVAWVNYAKSELVQAEIIEENSLALLKQTESMTLLSQWEAADQGETVTMAKARRDADPKVIECQSRHSEARAYRKLVDTVFDRGDRISTVLSRELSRRISLTPTDRRTQWVAP
jgi:hypothetical protein